MIDLEELRKRYTEREPGPCRVCGGALEVAASDAIETAWACVDGSRRADGTTDFDHYGRSRVKIPSGDSRVIAVLDELATLRAQLAAARALRLGRAPTVEEMEKHGHNGAWLLREARGQTWDACWMILKATGWWVDGSDTLSGCRIDDAIPLDTNGQPCPCGGWGGAG